MNNIPQQEESGRRAAAIVTLAGVALGVALALASRGGYHDDGLTHYLYARWSWSDARCLLDEWGRPGLTCLLFPVARLGWIACRIESVVLSGLAAWFAYLTAVRLGMKRAALVVPLAYCQPLFLMLSYDTMTETAVAFYLSLAVWLLVTRRATASAAVVSLCFVARYETLVLALVWLVALRSVRARWYAYPLIGWAPVLHNLVGVSVLGRWPFAFVLSNPTLSEYGQGTVLTMFIKSIAASGPTVALLAVVGCVLPWRRRGAWVVPAAYGAHLLIQTIIYWQGTHASGGYPRFLVSTAPLAAVAAVHAINQLAASVKAARRGVSVALIAVTVVAWIGLEIEPAPQDEAWVLVLDKVRPVVRLVCALVIGSMLVGYVRAGARLSLGRRGARGLLTFLALAGAVAPSAYFVRPHHLPPDASDVASAVAWIRDNDLAGAHLVTTNIWTSYFLGSDRNLTAVPNAPPLSNVEPGTVLLWDADYSPGGRFGISIDELTADESWRLLWSSRPRADGSVFAHVYRFVPGR